MLQETGIRRTALGYLAEALRDKVAGRVRVRACAAFELEGRARGGQHGQEVACGTRGGERVVGEFSVCAVDPVTATGESLFWAGLNKGKRSFAVDLVWLARVPR